MLDADKNYDNDDDAFMILPAGSDAKRVSMMLGEGGIYKQIICNSFSLWMQWSFYVSYFADLQGFNTEIHKQPIVCSWAKTLWTVKALFVKKRFGIYGKDSTIGQLNSSDGEWQVERDC